MNALLMAIVVTLIAILDYYWPYIEELLKQDKRAKRIKFIIVGTLLTFSWVQAGIQFHKDRESDQDMHFLKEQLASANKSLTNSTEVIRGLTTGGDSRAEFSFAPSINTDSNTFDIILQTGDYPLRNLYIKVKDETKRANRDRSSTNLPPQDSVLFERYLGDIPGKALQQICSAKLDPKVRNYIRFDVYALNGSYWQIINFEKTTNGLWSYFLNYRWSQIGGKFQIDPPSKRGVIEVDD